MLIFCSHLYDNYLYFYPERVFRSLALYISTFTYGIRNEKRTLYILHIEASWSTSGKCVGMHRSLALSALNILNYSLFRMSEVDNTAEKL